MSGFEIAVIQGSHFNPSTDIKYSKPKVDSHGSKSVGILNSASNTATFISTPLMLTWGVNEFVDEKSGKVSYDLALQFSNEGYGKPDETSFLAAMTSFENKIKEDAITNAKEWFGKSKMSPDAIDALWTPILKYPKDKATGEPDTTRSPTLKVKVPFWDGQFKIDGIFNTDQKLLYPSPDSPDAELKDLITKGSNVALVVLCGGIWFANGKFGVTWKLKQGIVKPRASFSSGKCHVILSDEDKERLNSTANNFDKEDEEDIDDEEEDDVNVDDSDEETESIAEEVKQEVAPEPEPEPEPAKKKVVKKKVVKKTA